MPEFDASTVTKINELRALRANATPIYAYEIVAIRWPSPTGTIYYSTQQLDEIATPPPVSPIQTRLMLDEGEPFLPINQSASIGDDETTLRMWDGPINGADDGAFSDLLALHGEGIEIEFFYWFPQVELLLSIWQAHLQEGEDYDRTETPITAAQGFRSADSTAPNRQHSPIACQAIFGGLLLSEAEQAAHPECNYNLHLSGPVGTLNPSTGEPWTFCPRLSTGNCVERGVNPLRHFSHQTIVSTVIGTQSSGGPTFSTSEGNETNLKDAVRVVMGTRRIYNMRVLAFQRHPVTSNPDHGFFESILEAGEGPSAQLTDVYVTIGNERKSTGGSNAIHFGANFGELGQAAISQPVTTHGFSGTQLIRFNWGWINPANVDQNQVSADGISQGLRDIRVYQEAGNGLTGQYFNDTTFANLVGQRIDPNINFPLQFGPGINGQGPIAFSIRWTGFITFPEAEAVDFTINHDDGVILTINGTEVMNAPAHGTDTESYSATAGTFPFQLDFVQGTDPGPHPWQCVLSWASDSIDFAVVPSSAFTTPAGHTTAATNNRAWQVARILCDKRWGFGYDYERLNLASFKIAADWVAEYVRFTDFNGTHWDHARGLSAVDLQEKKIQQQVEDMCLAGGLSRPFPFNGQIHIVPLSALTSGELAECPVFTDEGDSPNIIWDDDRSTLRWTKTRAIDLKNRVEATYDSAANNYLETPCNPVEDIPAQLAAGRVTGDLTKKVNTLAVQLLGVTEEAHAIKTSWRLLDLGEFDEGGLQNNLRVKFTAWFVDTLTIHPYKVIKVQNARIIAKYGFEYFRIVSTQRLGNLHIEIEAQAYNVEYMNSFETDVTYTPPPENPPTGPCEIVIGTITEAAGLVTIPIEPC